MPEGDDRARLDVRVEHRRTVHDGAVRALEVTDAHAAGGHCELTVKAGYGRILEDEVRRLVSAHDGALRGGRKRLPLVGPPRHDDGEALHYGLERVSLFDRVRRAALLPLRHSRG